MDVMTLLLDLAQGVGVPPRMAALTCMFRDGTQNTVLLTEEQLQPVALTVAAASRRGVMPTYEQLEGPTSRTRASEFLGSRERLRHPDLERWQGYVASDIRPFFHGGGVVLPAARADGTLFIGVFDPFSAHGVVHAAAATFE